MRFLRSSADALLIESENPDESLAAGRALGEALPPGMLLLLTGGLGMGKTKFTQGVGAALGIERVKSPTFIIMNEYDGKTPFLHADLYRLEDAGEVEELAIEEYLDDGYAAAVEWGERWLEPPEKRLEVEFSPSPAGESSRILTFRAFEPEGRALLAEFKEKILRLTENVK
ncbi:MAG: tRNA (adenosine(37)-N6)-threonylcarbamoyltransferase complex ATPase subunit type 1 TsaE [Synergistaceae bacterium]|nr:tRNA (adenosine(37)-N6)-threonylcarbamoyltransferase complex ATPase subunit type 1 TsaE [Synergistaceae bacterium]